MPIIQMVMHSKFYLLLFLIFIWGGDKIGFVVHAQEATQENTLADIYSENATQDVQSEMPVLRDLIFLPDMPPLPDFEFNIMQDDALPATEADDGAQTAPYFPTLNLQNTTRLDKDVPPLIAEFKTLDKVTARVKRLSVPMNKQVYLGNLEILMRYCKMNPPEETPETYAFLEVINHKSGESIFSGWMFASTPGINALEHPVYDIWPINCKTESGERFTGKE